MNDIDSSITAIAFLVTALAALIGSLANYRNGRKIEAVKDEVKTANSQTLAQLADADETRRIDLLPPKDRTTLEKSHLTDAAPPESSP